MAEATTTPAAPGGAHVTHTSGWQRLRHHRAAVFSLWFLGAMVICSLLSLWLPEELGGTTPVTFAAPGTAQVIDGQEFHHWFGTDQNGKDLLYRVFQGARISLIVGLCGALISLVIGVTYGMVSGYAGGRVDAFLMRVVDTLYSIPRLLFIMVFVAALDAPLKGWIEELRLWAESAGWEWGREFFASMRAYARIMVLIFTLGLVGWLTMARIIRGQVLALKEQTFVTAARAMGQSPARIIRKHLLPNLSTVILTYLTLTIPQMILEESFLSFLGLGIEDPAASWGSLLKEGSKVINPLDSKWWLLVFPAAFMSATLLALNFLGDGLRDAFDPRSRK
jgi:peptide/nickel transport system permease protein/oligopeptide transport system permease protein